METFKNGINIAKNSTSGHYIHNARQVINLDELNETYFVEGKSEMRTQNHTKLQINEDAMITKQVVYDPFAQAFTKSRD